MGDFLFPQKIYNLNIFFINCLNIKKISGNIKHISNRRPWEISENRLWLSGNFKIVSRKVNRWLFKKLSKFSKIYFWVQFNRDFPKSNLLY